MKRILVKTYEELEEKEIELVKDGYRLTDITRRDVTFTKFKCGITHEVRLRPAFWEANKDIGINAE